VYLEVVQDERLVISDVFTKAWEPSEKPFMTVVLTFEDQGGKRIANGGERTPSRRNTP
jgi:uncharacterized protein YndB with AHSA1/START domain